MLGCWVFQKLGHLRTSCTDDIEIGWWNIFDKVRDEKRNYLITLIYLCQLVYILLWICILESTNWWLLRRSSPQGKFQEHRAEIVLLKRSHQPGWYRNEVLNYANPLPPNYPNGSNILYLVAIKGGEGQAVSPQLHYPAPSRSTPEFSLPLMIHDPNNKQDVHIQP